MRDHDTGTCKKEEYSVRIRIMFTSIINKEEEQEVRRFEERSKAMTEKLMQDTQFSHM